MKFLISLFSLLLLVSSSLAEEPNPARLHLETILEKVAREFTPDFEKRRLRLVTKMAWNNKNLNAHARLGHFSQKKRVVTIYGEIMRRNLTEEAVLWPICHELGHHLGGKPVYADDGLSVEGQADYWAAQVCMPRLFKEEFMHTPYPPTADLLEHHFCREKFSAESDLIACARTLRGALEFHQALFANIRPIILKLTTPVEGSTHRPVLNATEQNWLKKYYAPHEPLYTTPDPRETAETIQEHPAHQCRLDTALAGALGNPRPKCWFKPE